MAIRSCPECNGKVSSTVPACPHCGFALGEAPEKQAGDSTGETVFLENADVKVTKQRFMVPGKTFALNQITSVTVASERRFVRRLIAIPCLVLGLPPLLTGLMSKPMNRELLMLGSSIFVIGLALWLTGATRYYVVVRTSGSEEKALGSPKRKYIEAVLEAVNKAIVARG
jgi:hypothetical protein